MSKPNALGLPHTENVRDARPGLLHFPKKPFVAKAARCELSTAQVLVNACVRHFWGGPYPTFFVNTLNGFDTWVSSGSTLFVPICSRAVFLAMASRAKRACSTLRV